VTLPGRRIGTFDGESCGTDANFDWDGMVLCLLTCLEDGMEDSDESVDGDGVGLWNSSGDGDRNNDGTGDRGDDSGLRSSSWIAEFTALLLHV
jgi:hypothetical protein